jgi:hypothetical protein
VACVILGHGIADVQGEEHGQTYKDPEHHIYQTATGPGAPCARSRRTHTQTKIMRAMTQEPDHVV